MIGATMNPTILGSLTGSIVTKCSRTPWIQILSIKSITDKVLTRLCIKQLLHTSSRLIAQSNCVHCPWTAGLNSPRWPHFGAVNLDRRAALSVPDPLEPSGPVHVKRPCLSTEFRASSSSSGSSYPGSQWHGSIRDSILITYFVNCQFFLEISCYKLMHNWDL